MQLENTAALYDLNSHISIKLDEECGNKEISIRILFVKIDETFGFGNVIFVFFASNNSRLYIYIYRFVMCIGA